MLLGPSKGSQGRGDGSLSGNRNLLRAKHLDPNLQAVEDGGEQEQNECNEKGNGGDAGKTPQAETPQPRQEHRKNKEQR